MKNIILIFAMLVSTSIFSERMCDVILCNRIERFSFSIWSHIKDRIGEACFSAVLPESAAIEGSILSAETRWYQGSSFNPTKKSVTRVKQVIGCK